MTVTPQHDSAVYSNSMGNPEAAALVIAQPPFDMTAGSTNRRLRVDVGEVGFFEGREFRIFRQFTTGQTIRIVTPINCILTGLVLSISAGHVTLNTYAGGTEGGTFAETIPVFPRNTMTERPTPYYNSQLTWATGGTHSGGTLIDVLELKTDSNTNRAASVGGAVGDARGVGPGTYYYVLNAIEPSIGTLHVRWEERP